MLALPLLSIVLTLNFLGVPAGPAEPPSANIPVEAYRTWQGIATDSNLLAVRPPTGWVADRETWAALWTAWRGEDPLPTLDFRTSIVLVGWVPGPNRARLSAFRDAHGHVVTRVLGTRKGGPGFGYVLWAVSRESLRSVDGQPVATEGS